MRLIDLLPVISEYRKRYGNSSLVLWIESIRFQANDKNDNKHGSVKDKCLLNYTFADGKVISVVFKEVQVMSFDSAISLLNLLKRFEQLKQLNNTEDNRENIKIEVWQCYKTSENLFIVDVTDNVNLSDSDFLKILDIIFNFQSNSKQYTTVQSIKKIILPLSIYGKLYIHFEYVGECINLKIYDRFGVPIGEFLDICLRRWKEDYGGENDIQRNNHYSNEKISDKFMEVIEHRDSNSFKTNDEKNVIDTTKEEQMDISADCRKFCKFKTNMQTDIFAETGCMENQVLPQDDFDVVNDTFADSTIYDNRNQQLHNGTPTSFSLVKINTEGATEIKEIEEIISNTLKKFIAKNFQEETKFVSIGMDSIKLALFEDALRRVLFNKIEVPNGCVYQHSNIRSLAIFLNNLRNKLRSIKLQIQPSERKLEKPLVNKKNHNFMNEFERERYDEIIGDLENLLKNDETIPLTSAQKRFIFINELWPNCEKLQFQEKIIIKLENANIKQLEKAINSLIGRQKILRTKYQRYYQQVLSLTESFFAIKNRSIRVENSYSVNIFDDIPLVIIIESDLSISNHFILQILLHHISTDGHSMAILANELCALYKGEILNQLAIHYVHYALIEKRRMEDDANLEANSSYWKQQFQGFRASKFPIDKPVKIDEEFRKSSLEYKFLQQTIHKINSLVDRFAKTEFKVILSIYFILISKEYCISDCCTGILISNRSTAELQNIIGCFVNPLPLRVQLTNSTYNFSTLLDLISQSLDNGIKHQLPFDDIVNVVNIERNYTTIPLFHTLLVMDTINNFINNKNSSLNWKIIEYNSTGGFYDQIWYFIKENENELIIRVEYNENIYYKQSIERLINKFLILIDQIYENPNRILENISMERRIDLLKSFRRKAMNLCDFPIRQTIIDIAMEQNKLSAYCNSFIFADKRFSNIWWEKMSNQLASMLTQMIIQRYGEPPQVDSVAIFVMERSTDMFLLLLSAWKCGMTVVPLSIDWPEERLLAVMKNIKYTIIFVSKKLLCEYHWILEGAKLIANCKYYYYYSATKQRKRQIPHDLAYITYTSGSTSLPKGICTELIGLNNLAMNYAFCFLPHSASRIYQVVNPSFDIFFADIIEAFCFGGTLIFAKNKIPDWSEMESITHAYIMPAYLSTFGDNYIPNLGKFEAINFGGDIIQTGFLERALQGGVQLYQQYGLTESTIYTTCKRMKKFDQPFMIGKPFLNTDISIRNLDRQRFPEKTLGFGCIEGIGLARGYFQDGILMQKNYENLIDQPKEELVLAKEKRYLWTGDKIEMLSDQGDLKFHGRSDTLIKIRGMMINVAEIEYYVSSLTFIESCVVKLQSFSNKNAFLICYITFRKGYNVKNFEDQIQTYLLEKLPEFMVPRKYLVVNRMPLNSNGKIDRSKLPIINFDEKIENKIKANENLTSAQRRLCEIFAEILGRSQISINDSFFDVGGDSLKALFCIQRIQKELGIEIHLKDILKNITFRQILDSILMKYNHNCSKYLEEPKSCNSFWLFKDGIPLNFGQESLWYLQKYNKNDPSYVLKMSLNLLPSIDCQLLNMAINYMIRNHAIFRTIIKEFRVQRNRNPSQCVLSLTESFIKLRDQLEFDEETFQMNISPPIKVNLQRNKHTTNLLIYIHHILTDGYSLNIAVQELLRYYGILKRNGISAKVLSCCSGISYAEFSYRQRIEWENRSDDVNEWVDKLRNIEPLNIATDFPRPNIFDGQGKVYSQILKMPLANIKEFCNIHKCTLFTYLVTCFGLLMRTLSGQNKFAIGTPSLNRQQNVLDTIGFFVNNIVICFDLNSFTLISDLIESIQHEIINALDHQHIPFELIVKKLNPIRDPSRSPIFQYSLVLQNQFINSIENDEKILLSVDEIHSGGAKFDQTWFFHERGIHLSLDIEFCTSLFRPSTIQQFAKIFENIMKSLIESKKINDMKFVNDVTQLRFIRYATINENPNNTSVKCNKQPKRFQGTEAKLYKIWSTFLQKPSIDDDDNFFAIGGHSLLAVKICSEISREFNIDCPIHIIFSHPTIKQLINYVDNIHSRNYANYVTNTTPLPLFCKLQEPILKMFFRNQPNFNMKAYETGFTVQIESLDVKSLRNILNRIIMRHSSLRTKFAYSNNHFYQEIYSGIEAFIPIIDYSAEFSDLSVPKPLLDISLICVAKNISELITDVKFLVNHVLADGRSMEIIQEELCQSYFHGRKLPKNTTTYSQFSSDFNKKVESFEKIFQYWQTNIKNIQTDQIQTDKIRSPIISNKSGYVERRFIGLGEVIMKLAQYFYCSPTAIILAGFHQIFALRKPAKSASLIAFPVDMRFNSADQCVGHCVNILPLIIKFCDCFKKLCKNIMIQIHDILENSFIPSEIISELLENKHTQLSIMISVNTIEKNSLNSNKFRLINENSGYTKYELTIFVTHCDETIDIKAEFMHEIFFTENIELMIVEWAKFITREARNWLTPRIAKIEKIQNSPLGYNKNLLTSEPNRSEITKTSQGNLQSLDYCKIPSENLESENSGKDTVELNANILNDLPRFTLPEFLRNTALYAATNKSFYNETTKITYNSMISRIDQISNVLEQKLLQLTGEVLRPDCILPVVAKKSLDILIVCLSIVYSGCAYLPIDIKNPKHRINEILDQLDGQVYISDYKIHTDSRRAINFNYLNGGSTREFFIRKQFKRLRNKPDDLGYVIFTSGSTGHPKGVAIKQLAIINVAVQSTQNFYMKSTDSVYQFTNFAFDNSVLEMIMALSNGAAIFVEETMFEIKRFFQEVERSKITHALLFPGLIHTFTNEEIAKLSLLRYWIVGAEKLDDETLNIALESGVRVIQNYGPTETTTYAIFKHMRYGDRGCNIGKPIANVHLSIVSDCETQSPLFVNGKLIIEGACLMRGYLNQDQMKIKEKIKSFDTGDIVKILPDKNCIFIGRSDRQIKIRGFRVEISEIEGVIRQINWVRQVRIIYKKHEQILNAYLTLVNGLEHEFNSVFLRNFCLNRLPYYMVPGNFYPIEQFPLTSNAKVSLDELLMKYENCIEQKKIPESVVEFRIWLLFKEILKIDNISTTDDFFLLGGNSLSATKLSNRISNEFSRKLETNDIFRLRTIKSLSLILANDKEEILNENDSKLITNEIQQQQRIDELIKLKNFDIRKIPLSFQQEQMFFLSETNQNEYYNLPFVQFFERNVNYRHLRLAFLRLIMRQNSLRTFFTETAYEFFQTVLSGTESYFHPPLKAYSAITLASDIKYLRKQLPKFKIEPPVQCAIYYDNDSSRFVVLLIIHHIISDAWSTRLIESEMSELYKEIQRGKFCDKKITYSYANFAQIQSNNAKNLILLSEEYSEKFVNFVINERSCLTFCHSNSDKVEFNECSEIRFILSEQKKLIDICNFMATTPFVIALANVLLSLHRISTLDTILVTAPIANRTGNTHILVGNFLNNLLIDSHYKSEQTINDYIKNLNINIDKIRKYEIVPYCLIIQSFTRRLSKLSYKKRLALTELYFNCRYELEDGSTNYLLTISENDFRPSSLCVYPLEIDVDMLHGNIQYTFRIRPEIGSQSDLILLKECVQEIYEQFMDLSKSYEIGKIDNQRELVLEKIDQRQRVMVPQNNLLDESKKQIKSENLLSIRSINDKIYISEDEITSELKLIWKKCLNNDLINENFFLSGGNSLLCLKLKRMISDKMNVEIPIDEIFENSNLIQMSHLIYLKKKEIYKKFDNYQSNNILINFTDKFDEYHSKIIVFFHPLVGGVILPYLSVIRKLTKSLKNYRIIGIQHPNTFQLKLIKSKYIRTINCLCCEYIKILKQIVQQSSDSVFIGASLGGILAYECAIQLGKNGIYVKRIICIDGNAQPSSIPPITFDEHVQQMSDYMSRFDKNEEFNEEIRNAAINSSWELLKMVKFYVPESNERIELYLLKTENESDEDDYGWSKLCQTSVLKINGNHQNMLDDVNSDSLAKIIVEIITKI